MSIKKSSSINEHVDRLKFLFKYQLKEANYKLVDNLDEDDEIPNDVWKEPSPIPTLEEEEPVVDDQMNLEELPAEEPAIDMGAEEEVAVEPTPDMDMGIGGEPMAEPVEQSVDDLQNNILKTSVSAMQKMNAQLSNLETTLNSLNQKMDGLNKEVEEVREPTNVEKLVARKEDSHPFYMNLSDMWDGNSFQARRQVDNSHGIRKLDDGTYIADFDTLPKYNEQEIKDSFR